MGRTGCFVGGAWIKAGVSDHLLSKTVSGVTYNEGKIYMLSRSYL
jgi:hypothetical protein